MVQLTVRLTAASGRAHQLVQALRSLMRQARQTDARPPILEFQVIAETRGLEYMTAVRGSGYEEIGTKGA